MSPLAASALAILCLALVGCGETPDEGDAPGSVAADSSLPGPRPDDPPDGSRFFGITHPPLPEGVRKRSGALATDVGESAAETRFGFQDVIAPGGRWLWLSHLEGDGADAEGLWRVVDAEAIGEVGGGERLVIHGCAAEGRAVAAVVTIAEGAVTGVRRAWRADRDARVLLEVEPSVVECGLAGFSGSPERAP